MRRGKQVTRKSKPQISPVVIRINSGDKLLWQRNPNPKEGGFCLNIVDASVQN